MSNDVRPREHLGLRVAFSALREEPVRSLIGAGWIAAGIPVYFFFKRSRSGN